MIRRETPTRRYGVRIPLVDVELQLLFGWTIVDDSESFGVKGRAEDSPGVLMAPPQDCEQAA